MSKTEQPTERKDVVIVAPTITGKGSGPFDKGA